MDHQRDFEPFKRLLSRLCVTFDKFATEELIEAWWKALRREPFPAVERAVDAFIANANDKTRFPRPGQFAGATSSQNSDNRQSEANARNWTTFIADHPKTGPIRQAMAKNAAIMAREHESTPAYAEAHDEYVALERQLGACGRFSADA